MFYKKCKEIQNNEVKSSVLAKINIFEVQRNRRSWSA